MLHRIAHFKDLREDRDLYLDDRLPGHVRSALMLIGTGGGRNDPSRENPLPAENFTMGMQKASPGNGPGLHSHSAVEVFVVLSGTWRFSWIDAEGTGTAVLGPHDVFSVPAHVWRAAENCGDDDGILLAVRGARDGGGISWHPSIIEDASRFGRTLDEDGRLVVSQA
jgi:quercetin dioxygenase-like cupin family protein